ncbi:MAG: FAD:protein FMN transferase [Terracidiphilus sp.]|nr:FAD:protein FMN transferase [Terracidiphilus sp.]
MRVENNPMNVASTETQAVRVHRHGAMGTEFWLYLVDEGGERGADGLSAEERALVQAVWDEVDRVEGVFSRFRESSEISRLNRLAALGPMVTDPEVFSLLLDGRRLWEKTGGAFDIALGRVSRAWGFAERMPRVPEEGAREEAEAAAGMALVELDEAWRTVGFARPGVELDLGAFAKGYAVDCALGVLRGVGAAGLINAGRSSIGAVGEPFESGWRVEVRAPVLGERDGVALPPISAKNAEKDGAPGYDRSHPSHKNKDVARVGHPEFVAKVEDTEFVSGTGHPECSGYPAENVGRVLRAVALHGRALGSSGIMEQKFEEGGRVYSHLLDPRKLGGDGEGRGGVASAETGQTLQVTVLAESAAEADALSTALFVLGPDEGAAVMERFENCAALWAYQDAAGIGTREWNWPRERH